MNEDLKLHNYIELIDSVILPVIDEPVCVSVSGGADSALLLYYVMKYYNSKIYITTLADRSKNLKNTKKSISVVSKCAELTSNTNFIHMIDYADTQTLPNLFNLSNQLFEDNLIKFRIHGITANPPNTILEKFNNITTEHTTRDPSVHRSIINGKYIRPWTNINKKIIAQMYIKENLMESLFPLTSSCEWKEGSPYNKGVDPYVDHCGYCWWCQERIWGFGRLT